MQTQAYFDNIQTTILSEIDKAKASLQVAVAWLTDKTIFDKLCAKASKGVKVELLFRWERRKTVLRGNKTV